MVLSLFSDTFIWMNERQILVYNCGNGTYCEVETNPTLASLCKHLQAGINLYSSEIDESDMISMRFAQAMVGNNLGILHEIDNYISFPPILKIQEHMTNDRIQKHMDSRYNLRSISLFIGGKCNGNDLLCLQSDYPISSDAIMSCRAATDIIQKYSRLADEVRIIISDINKTESLKELLDLILGMGNKVVLCLRMNDEDIDEVIKRMGSTQTQLRLVGFPEDYVKYVAQKDLHDSVELEFLVGSNQDYQFVEALPESIQDCMSVVPVFDGTNRTFIEENIRIDKATLLGTKRSKRHVFIHQKINSELYGRLFIYPDGSIRPSPIACPIGSIETSPHDVILEALAPDSPWYNVRGGVCETCLYKYLCPSPSILETLIKMMCVLK